MYITSSTRTIILCICLVLLLIQVPDWAHIPQFIGIFCVLSVIFNDFLQKNIRFNVNLITIFAFLYVIYGIFGLFISEIPFSTIKMLPIYLMAPLLLLSAASMREGADYVSWPLLSKFLILCGGILSLYALFQIYSQSGYYVTIANYPFYNPNSLAVFLGVCFLASLHKFLSNTRPSIIYCIVTILIFLGVCTTGSKAAFIAIVTMSFIMIFICHHMQSSINYKKLVYMSAGIVIAAIIAPELIQMMVANNGGKVTSLLPVANSANTRLVIWQGAITTALSTHPFAGNGIGTFKDVYLQYRMPGDKASGNHAHNDILHIWVEMGICGLMIFALGVLGFLFALKQIWINKINHHILPALIIIFCGGMALITPIIFLPPIMLIVALALAVIMPKKYQPIPYGDYIRQALMVVVILIGCLSARNLVDTAATLAGKSSMDKGDLNGFLTSIDVIDTVSFGLSPSVPIHRASSLLALYDGGVLPSEQLSAALDEVTYYIDDAKRRNPYNPEILYYRGEVAMRKGEGAEAVRFWENTIALDPSYVVARMKLMNLTDNHDDKMALIRDGIYLKYWKQNPTQFYAMALIEAKKSGDKDLIRHIQAKIKKSLNNKR